MGFAAAFAAPAWASHPTAHQSDSQDSQPAPTAKTVEGRLLRSGGGVMLAAGGRQIRLGSASPFLLHTLADPRLANREVRLEGAPSADGAFQAEHLWTVKAGKLYKVRYYCHVCNIAAIEPGPCVCCQRWTDLEEIPVEEVTPDMLVVP